ncbi:MAG: endopeptidase family protein [Magnetococcales bacterium]|nr:endopeptidase family protein [Magnetococcales bacterium]HIJ85501.1 M48 family metallopeptidase [Magnetococcales bacterium]
MNDYAWLILITLLAGFLLETVATLLNIGYSPEKPPVQFQDCFDQDRFLRTRKYLAEKGKLGLIVASWDLVLLLLWWRLGGFNLLDQWLRPLLENELLRGVAYIGILALVAKLLHLPFSIYDTFIVENRFGFNRTTPITFTMDLVKSLALSLVLGGGLLWCVLWFFQKTGPMAWLYCWLSVTLFSLTVQYVAPRWIFPLFFHFKPLPDGPLREALLEYARKVQFSVKDVFEVDGSRRSTKANAFFTGYGSNRRIALFDTLIHSHSQDEVIAVLAHEVGHFKHRHILKGMAIGIVHMGLIFFLMSFFLANPALSQAFSMETVSSYSGLVFFSLLLTPLDLLVGPLFKWYSRKNEFQADRFAVQTVPNPMALVSALKKLAADSLSNLTPHPLHVILHDTHPPLIQRINNIGGISMQK